MKKYCYSFFLIIFLFCFTNASFPQFIANKGEGAPDSYRNFAGRNYENYSTTFIKKKFFDNFGNFLLEGTTVYELSEIQSQQSGNDIIGGQSDIIKSRYYTNYFNNLVIGNDTYGGFETRLMVGDAIRTKFTNLTLNRARFNGIRWDAGTVKYRGTVVASRVSDPIRFNFNSTFPSALGDGVRRIRDWTQYLFGGHFETDIGDVLTLGVTYVNQHQRRSSIDSKEASLKGVVANAIPRVIFLKISDDSPNDKSGPVIFAPPTIIINGQPRPTRNLIFQSPPSGSVALDQPINYWVLRDKDIPQTTQLPGGGFTINDRNFFTGADTTSYSRYTNYAFRYSVAPPVYPFMVSSSQRENLVYAYVIPEGTESVQFQIILANDYRVETAHDYINVNDSYSGAGFSSHSDTLQLGTPTPFFLRASAEGNVRDGSNKRIVMVNYGLTSGMSVYGMNFKFNWNGFDIEGEFNESVEFLKYPLLSGNRFESKGRAWYLRGKKEFGRFTVGGERYTISPDYITYLNTYVMENSYFSSPTENSRVAIPNSIDPDFLGFDGSFAPPFTVLFPGGVFYPLVDDNDDNDRYEDGFYHYDVRTTDINFKNRDVINQQGDYFKLGYRQNINELRSLQEIVRRPDTGIFPGKDRDNDGIPDDDRNADGIPDFSQDFLTYYADPPSLDFGDDWNNNGVIDQQENDILPDYPYEPDINGYHIFSQLKVLDGLQFSVGKINETAIRRGGTNDLNYFKSEYFTSTPKFGSFRIFYVMKQVQDNIANNGYQFRGVITASDPYPDYVVDPLNYRNSFVNSLYLGTTYTQIQNVNIENNVRIELNKQFAIGNKLAAFETEARLLGDQVPGRIVFWGIVNKIDYTFSLLNNVLKISPQLKVRTEKIKRTSEARNANTDVVDVVDHRQEIIPIIRVDYHLTENTAFRFGVQGFTIFKLTDFLLHRVRNYKNNVESQNRSTIAFSISNKSQYAGYNIVLDFGFKSTSISFLRPQDRHLGNQESSIFFSVYAGF